MANIPEAEPQPVRPNPTVVSHGDSSWLAVAVACVVLAVLVGLIAAGVI